MLDGDEALRDDLRLRVRFARWSSRICSSSRRFWTCLASTISGHSNALAGGMKDIARSASAVIVNAGFTPGFAEIADPSIT